MPTLNWIGKEAVVKHHKEVPFRLLEPIPELSCGTADSNNLIVQGDNLHALKALLPRYAGQIKCIYIDPPYNTGNEGWAYNDNVNSPEIRRWLGEVVGKEGETLDRHDRWLCMMYPRLLLLRQFLREDGAIFVSIDDNEVASLRLVMDEVFGASNFMSQLVWKARQYLDSRSLTGISNDHEYVLAYSRIPEGCKFKGQARDETKYSNPDGDPRTGLRYPCPENTGWRYSQDTMAEKLAEGRILFPKKPTGRPREKVFLNELKASAAGFPSVIDGVFTADGSQAVRDIFGQQNFAFPKAPELVQRLIAQVAETDSLILDSFAGSGTTGHAVLKQNAEDGGNRRFILVEMEENIARTVTAERVRRVAQGYTTTKGKAVEGLGGGFRFYRLSAEPLFMADGQIRPDVSFAQLAEGWDCPFAYLLVSMASLHSATAVEQLLGRVLRQPDARHRRNRLLNQSYAFVVSRNFAETASTLRDRLVAGAGFERREAAEISRTTAIEFFQTPAELGERFRVPQLTLRVQGELQLFDDPEVLEYPWDLSYYQAAPGPEDLTALGAGLKMSEGGEIDVDAISGRMVSRFLPELQRDLGLAYQPEHWDEVRLAAWLCRNLPEPSLTHASKQAFVAAWLTELLRRKDFTDLNHAEIRRDLLSAFSGPEYTDPVQ